MRCKSLPPEMAIHGDPPQPRRNVNGDRLLTVASCVNPGRQHDRETFLPMIRIRGRWLRELGFAVGKRVAVKIEDKRLVLTIEKE